MPTGHKPMRHHEELLAIYFAGGNSGAPPDFLAEFDRVLREAFTLLDSLRLADRNAERDSEPDPPPPRHDSRPHDRRTGGACGSDAAAAAHEMDDLVSAFQTAFDEEDDSPFAELCSVHDPPLVWPPRPPQTPACLPAWPKHGLCFRACGIPLAAVDPANFDSSFADSFADRFPIQVEQDPSFHFESFALPEQPDVRGAPLSVVGSDTESDEDFPVEDPVTGNISYGD
ncbi:hypothetical protein CYMTET_42660 [Cymbomonas tetramitiformis]|uniref:Uncharacterized protein n=1 Tax=Cymbomonas tetramitiformis TaxID=36881 RepID=A0AAE0F1A6_9CHLO|nr:hypothetical protein CYMTET_42660 [Cymbomonas tetramitiformis]